VDDLADLADRAAAVEPIDLEVGSIDGPHPGAAFLVAPQTPLRALRDALHAAEIFKEVAHTRLDVPFHLTVAEFVSHAEGWRIVTSLRDVRLGAFRCVEVAYAAPDDEFRFAVRTSLPLRG
jgi:hypothetical protein